MSKSGSTLLTPTGKHSNAALIWGAVLIAFFLGFFFIFRPILTPFIVSAVIAFAVHPLLVNLKKLGVSRAMGSTLILVFVIILFILVFLISGPLMVSEAQQLIKVLPPALGRLLVFFQENFQGVFPENFLADINLAQKLQENVGKVFSFGATLTQQAISGTLAVVSLISTILLTPVLLFYFLRDWPKITIFIESLIPENMKSTLNQLFNSILDVIKHYFRGVLSVALVLVIYYCVMLNIIGVKFALTLGILSGLLVVIPYVGFFFSFVAAVAIYYPSVASVIDMWPVIAVYLFAQLLESFILTPKLVGDQVGLHPLWVLFALLGGAFLYGFLGVLLAVPVAGCLAVLLRFAMSNYRSEIAPSSQREVKAPQGSS